jgi:hypothetical protein
MHWIDPAQLTPIKGTLERFLLTPHGDLNGFILRDGTEVHFPPHLSAAVRKAARPGSEVVVYGLRPRRAAVLAAVAIEVAGETILDEGPPKDEGPKKPSRIPLDASGTVVRPLHGPKGEFRGALLDEGTIVRVGKHAGPHVTAAFAAGRTVAVRGEGRATSEGRCIEARLIGRSMEDLEPIDRPPPHPKPKPARAA